MSDMSFNVQTPIYVGENCMKKHADALRAFGKRAYVITSDFGEIRDYAREDVEEILQELGVEYKINDSVEENPPAESVQAIAKDAKEFQPDYLIAVGGGSSMDTAKGVSVLLPRIDEDPYKVFWGDGGRHTTMLSEGSLPLVVAPTTAGTGSEVTSAAVITRADKDTKQVFNQNVYCDLAFLDPRYIMDSPEALLHVGLMDALSHSIESYVNVKSNVMTRAMGEMGMKMFANFKDHVLEGKLTMQDYEDMLVASFFDGIAFQCGTGLPHGMGYPLSHHKDVPHGLACGIFQAEYLRSIKDQSIVAPIIASCGFKDIDEFADYIRAFMEKDVQFTVTEEELEEWAELFMVQEAHRLTRHPEKIEKEDILEIYRKSLKNYIK